MAISVIVWTFALAVSVNEGKGAAYDVVKAVGDSKLYLVGGDGATIHYIPDASIFYMYYTGFGAVTVNETDLSGFTAGNNLSIPAGVLVKAKEGADHPEVYLAVKSDTKIVLRHVKDMDAFNAFGLQSKNLFRVPYSVLSVYDKGDELTKDSAVASVREMNVVKYAGASDVYLIEGGKKKHIASETAYRENYFGSFARVITIADTEVYTDDTAIAGPVDAYKPTVRTSADVPVVTGDLTVALAASTPASSLAPKYSYGKEFTKLTLTGASTTITSITVTREGLGANTDFAGVYLYVDGIKTTSARTFNSANKALFSLGAGLKVEAGTSKTLSIVADMGNITATGQHRLGIAAAADIVSNSTTGGTFPIYGNYMSTSTTQVGQVTIVPGAISDTELIVGEQNQELARFTFTAGSAEKVKLNSIRFRQIGSLNTATDLANFKLYRGGTLLEGTSVNVSGDYITVSNINYTFEKSAVQLIKLFGDITGGGSSTVQFSIEEASDVSGTGLDYGYGITVNTTVDSTTWSEPKSHTTAVTIVSGELTFAISGPASQTVDRKTDDIVIANIKITTAGNESINIRKLYGAILGTIDGGAQNMERTVENIQLVQKTGGSQTIDATAADATANDNDTFYFPNFDVKGETTWDVIMDTADSYTVSADKYQFAMSATYTAASFYDAGSVSAVDARNAAGKQVANANIKPGSAISSNLVTLSDAGLTVANTGLAAGNSVAKEKNVDLIKLQLVGGSAGDVKITQMVFVENSSSTATVNEATNYSLYKVGTEAALQTGVSASGSGTDFYVTFGSIGGGTGLVIKANETATVIVKTDLASTVTNGSALILDSQADGITAEKVSDGNSLGDVDISGNDTALLGRTITFQTSGILTVSLNSDLTNANTTQVVAGTADVVTMNLKLKAQYENVNVKKLVLTNVNSSAADSIASVSLYNGSTKVVDALWAEAANTATFGDGVQTFISFEKDKTVTLTVKTTFKTLDGTADGTADSGDEVRWQVANASTTVTATGASSNTDLSYNATYANSAIKFGTATPQANQTGNIFHVRRDAISGISSVALTDTVLSDGTMKIFSFKVTAAKTDNQNAAVDLTKLYLTVSGAGLTGITSVTIYRTDATGTTVAATSSSTSAINFDDISSLVNVAPGESATFVVEGEIAGASAGDTLQVRIASLGAQGTETTVDYTAGDLIWSDNDNEVDNDVTSWIAWPGMDINSVTGTTLIKPSS